MCSSRSDKLSPILNPNIDRRADGVSPEDSGEEDSTGFATHESPEDTQDSATDILPRDLQQKTATYDYAFEKSMSHAEAKLFYQHHQLSSASKGDSPASPIPTGRQAADMYDSKVTMGAAASPLQQGQVARESSMGGDPEWHLGPSFQHDEASAAALQAQNSQLAADLSARNHAMPLGGANPSTHGAYLTATPTAEGIQGLGLGIGLSQAAAGFAPGGDAVTSELNAIYRKIKGLLERRSKYMALSLQRPEDDPRNEPEWEIYPPPPEPAWDEGKEYQPGNAGGPSDLVGKKRKMGEDIGEDFDMTEMEPLPKPSSWTYRLDGNSVYQVYESETAADQQEPAVQIPSLRDFYMDLDAVVDVSTDGPTKSFAFKRLSYLEGKFQLYALLNEYQEIADSKKVPHRDFYNVRKVDTHVHHSACMNQKHLLRFIKSKMRKSPDEVVLFRDGKHLTLREVFESINLTAYDLSIDTLDMHVRSPGTRPWSKLTAVLCFFLY
jgi:AMP deaminase